MGNIKNEHIRTAVLPQYLIDPALDGQLRRSRNIVLCDDKWSHGGESIQALSKIPLLMACLHISGTHIIDHRIAEYIVKRRLPSLHSSLLSL